MTDSLQTAWQSQPPPGRLTVNAQLLQSEVQRNQRSFRSAIFWRDVREIGIALVLVPVWIYMGRLTAEFWTWYLAIPAILWIPLFMIVDRHRHRRPPPSPAMHLRDSLEHSLAEVEHQIHLLRNIFWWYIFPFVPPVLAFIIQITWVAYPNAKLMAVIFSTFCGYIGLSLFLIYRINQHAVRTSLEPRREELRALLADLRFDDSPAGIGEGGAPAAPS